MTHAAWHTWLAFGEMGSRFAWANWALHSTCLLACGCAVARTRRLSAASRHAALTACLLLAAVSPIFSSGQWSVVSGQRPVLSGQCSAGSGQREVVSSQPSTVADQTPTHPLIHSPTHPCTPARLLIRYPATLLTCGWLLAVFVRLATLLGASVWLSRRRAGASPADRDRIYDACRYATIGIPVLESDRVGVPMAAGVVQPCILLPTGMTGQLPPVTLRHVLLHETAHVGRRDPLWFCAAEIARALLFWHPLSEPVRRALVHAAEDACDARVLAAGEPGPGYARTLLAILDRTHARPFYGTTCPLGAPGGELRRRIVRILAGPDRTAPLTGGVTGGMLALSAAATIVLHLGAPPTLPWGPSGPSGARSARPSSGPIRRRLVLVPFPAGEPEPRPVAPLPSETAAPWGHAVETRPFAPKLASGISLPGLAAELAPSRDQRPRESRCVVFVLDTSSEMQGFAAAARDQVLAAINRLGPRDHFNVVACDSEVHQFAETPVTASEDSRLGVADWLSRFAGSEAGDSLQAALRVAMATPEVSSVILLARETAVDAPAVENLVEQENLSHAQVLAYAFDPTEPTNPSYPTDPSGNPESAAQQASAAHEKPGASRDRTTTEAPQDLRP